MGCRASRGRRWRSSRQLSPRWLSERPRCAFGCRADHQRADAADDAPRTGRQQANDQPPGDPRWRSTRDRWEERCGPRAVRARDHHLRVPSSAITDEQRCRGLPRELSRTDRGARLRGARPGSPAAGDPSPMDDRVRGSDRHDRVVGDDSRRGDGGREHQTRPLDDTALSRGPRTPLHRRRRSGVGADAEPHRAADRSAEAPSCRPRAGREPARRRRGSTAVRCPRGAADRSRRLVARSALRIACCAHRPGVRTAGAGPRWPPPNEERRPRGRPRGRTSRRPRRCDRDEARGHARRSGRAPPPLALGSDRS